MGTAVAAILWLLSRWSHEVLRCMRGAAAGAFGPDACTSLVESPSRVFDLWLLVLVLSAVMGVVLIVVGRKGRGALVVACSLAVFVLAASFM